MPRAMVVATLRQNLSDRGLEGPRKRKFGGYYFWLVPDHLLGKPGVHVDIFNSRSMASTRSGFARRIWLARKVAAKSGGRRISHASRNSRSDRALGSCSSLNARETACVTGPRDSSSIVFLSRS